MFKRLISLAAIAILLVTLTAGGTPTCQPVSEVNNVYINETETHLFRGDVYRKCLSFDLDKIVTLKGWSIFVEFVDTDIIPEIEIVPQIGNYSGERMMIENGRLDYVYEEQQVVAPGRTFEVFTYIPKEFQEDWNIRFSIVIDTLEPVFYNGELHNFDNPIVANWINIDAQTLNFIDLSPKSQPVQAGGTIENLSFQIVSERETYQQSIEICPNNKYVTGFEIYVNDVYFGTYEFSWFSQVVNINQWDENPIIRVFMIVSKTAPAEMALKLSLCGGLIQNQVEEELQFPYFPYGNLDNVI